MTDKPILFSAPMVRALLDGSKTQTRRILKPAPLGHVWKYGWDRRDGATFSDDAGHHMLRIWAGDHLYVREHWRADPRLDSLPPRKIATNYPGIKYAATDDCDFFRVEGKFRQAMHMPRWASRLTLTVTDVRVERLQDISEEDAKAEGVEQDSDGWRDYLMPSTQCCFTATQSYQTLWDSINGEGAWDANPWVVAYFFRVHRCNIDQMAKEAA